MTSTATVMALLERMCMATIALAFVSTTAAQEVIPDFYKDPGLYPNRSYVNQSFGEHIDPFTGALQLHYVDLHLPGDGGFDLKVVRSYNSASVNPLNPAAYESLAGLGWTIHFGRVLSKNTSICTTNMTSVADNPVLELPDGSRQLLAFTGLASPMALTTQRWRADCLNGSSLRVFSPDGVRYDMTQLVGVGINQYAWYTTTITDRNGNTATVNYNAPSSQEIGSVATSDGRTLSFSYAGGGTPARRITQIVGAPGQSFFYSYVAVSGVANKYFLDTVTRPDSTQWRYWYNGILNNNASPGSYILRQLTYPEGASLNYTYRFVAFDSQSPTATTAVDVKTASLGGSWSFAYAPGAPNVLDTTTVLGPSGTTTYRHVGPNYTNSGTVWMVGLLISKQIGSVQTETYTWDKQSISPEDYLRPGAWFLTKVDNDTFAPVLVGRSIERNSQAHSSTFSNFDSHGNPQSINESGPNGGNRTISATYYTDTSKWIVKQPKNQQVVGGVDIRREFDPAGNLQSIYRDGVMTSYLYDARGNVTQATFPRTLIHNYSNYKRGIPQAESQPEGITISRIVSDAGNVVSETNGELATTTFGYDGLNRLASIGYPLGSPVSVIYGATSKTATRGSLTETTSYDGFGRPSLVTLGGIQRAYRHDALGRRTFESNPGNTSIGTNYEYDILDRVTRVTNADLTFQQISYGAASKTVADERFYSTRYTYRSYGDPTQQYLMSVSAPDVLASMSVVRDTKDLVRSVSQAGFTRAYDYYPTGHLQAVTNPETGVTTYGRDAAGNLTSKAVGTSGTTFYGYDGQNRLANVTYPGSTPAVTKTYWKTHKLKTVNTSIATRSYGYDSNGNLTNETVTIDGVAMSTGYGYTSTDQLSTVTYPRSNRVVSYSPDALGRPTQVSGFVTSISYWPSGQINQISYANGAGSTYGQNSRLWPSSFSTSRTTATYLSNGYSYDGVGNLTSITDAVDASYRRTLGYDNLNRVTSASGPWGSGSITYDGSGNVRSQTLGSFGLTYSYNDGATNRLSSVSGSRNATYSYDAYANITGASGISYSYDGAPNLTCINCADAGNRITYQYDGLNQRVSVTKGSVKTYEAYDSRGNLLVEYAASPNARLAEYIYLAGKRVAQVETVPPAVTATLTQSVATTVAGSPYIITWASSSASGCTVDYSLNGAAPVFYSAAFSGTATISPTVVGSYVWRNVCIGIDGVSTAQATFTHAVVAGVSATINQSLTTTVSGSPYTITWGSTAAVACTVDFSRNGEPPVFYSSALSGSASSSPSVVGTHVWRNTCSGATGDQSQASYTHTVTALPGAKISPSLAFANVSVGSISTFAATLTNTGSAALSITVPAAASVNGTDFSFVSTTCPASLAAGAICTVNVRFSPTAAVSRNGSLTVTTGVGNVVSAISGTGVVQPAVSATISQSLATTVSGSPYTISWSSSGAVSCTVDFSRNDEPPVFHSSALSGSLSNSPSVVGTHVWRNNCTGTGASQSRDTYTHTVTPLPGASITPGLAFGTVVIGGGPTLPATVTNTGAAALSITVPTAASVSGNDFSFVSTTCSASLAVGATCAVTVRFMPTAAVSRNGSLVVTTGVGNVVSAISGTGQ